MLQLYLQEMTCSPEFSGRSCFERGNDFRVMQKNACKYLKSFDLKNHWPEISIRFSSFCYVSFQFFSFLNTTTYSFTKKCPYSEFFWSVFFRILTDYGEIRSISSYSVQMQGNTYQKDFQYGHFSRTDRKTFICLGILLNPFLPNFSFNPPEN